MIVNSNNKVIVTASGKVLINDPINEFLGTVSNLWSNPANWSLGVLPGPNQTAIISADCVKDVPGTVVVKGLYVGHGIVLNIAIGTVFITYKTVNYGLINANSNLVLQGNYSDQLVGVINFNGSGSIHQIQFTGEYEFPSSFTLINGQIRILNGAVSFKKNVTFPGVLQVNTATAVFKIIEGVSVDVIGEFLIDNTMTASLQLGINSKLTVHGTTATFTLLNATNDIGSEIEIKRNISINHNNINLHTANLRLTTNDKTFTTYGSASIAAIINNIAIEDVVVDYVRAANTNINIATVNLNGKNAASIWNNRWLLRIRNPEIVMSIGVFNAFFDDSIVSYDLAGNQNIRVPDDAGYKELRLEGSGAKKLTGNTTCDHLYFSGTATLDENGYSLTGYTKYTDIRSQSTVLPSGSFEDLTVGNSTKTLSGNLSISGSFFQISNVSLALSGFTITATNFFNRNSGTTQIAPATVSATNWYYDNSGYQSVAAGTYNNLTLSGSGIKTLQGNVIVTGTYQRTGTATINKNGFTIKNGSGVDLE